MAWYSAHIIQHVVFLDGVQDRYPCYENVVLIEAESVESALAKADQIGRLHYNPSSDSETEFTWENRAGRLVYDGIRKIVQCDNVRVDRPAADDPDFSLESGTELTYSLLDVRSEDALAKLVKGEAVTVLYEN